MTRYKVKDVRPNVIAVVVPDDYERAMLFWRAQEFYESPCKRFRGGTFSVWDYARWYAKKYGGCFSYTKDFVGFNLPLVVAKKCYDMNPVETPYDEEMKSLVDSLFVNGERKYMIGAESLKGSTFDHEMAHALYYTDDSYRNSMDEVTGGLPKSSMSAFKKNLAKIGYCRQVVWDEIQAYMSTEISPKLCRGVRGKKSIHKRYRAVFKDYR
jgi:hypothetical protein